MVIFAKFYYRTSSKLYIHRFYIPSNLKLFNTNSQINYIRKLSEKRTHIRDNKASYNAIKFIPQYNMFFKLLPDMAIYLKIAPNTFFKLPFLLKQFNYSGNFLKPTAVWVSDIKEEGRNLREEDEEVRALFDTKHIYKVFIHYKVVYQRDVMYDYKEVPPKFNKDSTILLYSLKTKEVKFMEIKKIWKSELRKFASGNSFILLVPKELVDILGIDKSQTIYFNVENNRLVGYFEKKECITIRKVLKIASSYYLTIPKPFVDIKGWREGQLFIIDADIDKKILYIIPTNEVEMSNIEMEEITVEKEIKKKIDYIIRLLTTLSEQKEKLIDEINAVVIYLNMVGLKIPEFTKDTNIENYIDLLKKNLEKIYTEK